MPARPPPLALNRILAFCLALLAMPQPAPAEVQGVSEYAMKAVLFFRLPQFVYWPPLGKVQAHPVLCIAGNNPFGNNLQQLGEGNTGVDIRAATQDIGNCHFLFISRSETGNLTNWLNRTEGRQIFTVSDIAGFARMGGMIEFPLESERVGIVANRRVATKAGFELNAQLLRLGRVIE